MIVLQRQEYKTGEPYLDSSDAGTEQLQLKEGIYLVDSTIQKRITHRIIIESELGLT
jgi:hypothetical protein